MSNKLNLHVATLISLIPVLSWGCESATAYDEPSLEYSSAQQLSESADPSTQQLLSCGNDLSGFATFNVSINNPDQAQIVIEQPARPLAELGSGFINYQVSADSDQAVLSALGGKVRRTFEPVEEWFSEPLSDELVLYDQAGFGSFAARLVPSASPEGLTMVVLQQNINPSGGANLTRSWRFPNCVS